MKQETLENNARTYGVEYWGAGYFGINEHGNLNVYPKMGEPRGLDIKEIVDGLVRDYGHTAPFLLRFPQILGSQVQKLHHAMEAARAEYGYGPKHYPVYPMKVNPRKEVVEGLLRADPTIPIGLECGSKPELYAALGTTQPEDSLLICNGFKDESFLRLGFCGAASGKKVILVVEKLNELKMAVAHWKAESHNACLGLRVKLYSRGTGKWAASGGEAAKFGLTTSEILECIRTLKENGLEQKLRLLHFHIGSQITNIKRIKNAVREAARVYAKVRKMGIEVEYLDIGGGMGVDYDGSKSDFDSSVNYSPQEFANDVIYTVKSICEEEEVPPPHIITESGRVLTAYHSVLITSVWDEIETFADHLPPADISEEDTQVLHELKSALDEINVKNYFEMYHDALEHKDELNTQFMLGLITLQERAKGEVLFWEVCARALKLSSSSKNQHEEFEQLKKTLASKYLGNFSVFRSAPDHWAIGQLFPVMPIHRLNEVPSEHATMVDVTCDSDGRIDKFVDLKDVKDTLELHSLGKETYYLGIFLVGAYQEVMGSHHNLFGNPAEAQVEIDENGKAQVVKFTPSSTLREMVALANFDEQGLWANFQRQVNLQIEKGKISREVGEELMGRYRRSIELGSYLQPSPQ